MLELVLHIEKPDTGRGRKQHDREMHNQKRLKANQTDQRGDNQSDREVGEHGAKPGPPATAYKANRQPVLQDKKVCRPNAEHDERVAIQPITQPSPHRTCQIFAHRQSIDIAHPRRSRLLFPCANAMSSYLAGYAPVFTERALDDPALGAARQAVDLVLAGQSQILPWQLTALTWMLVASNRAVGRLLGGVAATLLQPPVNVLRLTLHPDGLAPRYCQSAGVARASVGAPPPPDRPQRRHRAGGVCANCRRIRCIGIDSRTHRAGGMAEMVVPFQLSTEVGVLTFFSTTMVFVTRVDITLSELAVESFFPADGETGERLKGLARGEGGLQKEA